MIQFRDVKPNYPVFVLDKQKMEVAQGKVTGVGIPHMETDPRTGNSRIVVDVTIDVNGRTATYNIPENLAVTYTAGDLVLATEKQGLTSELEAMRSTAEQIINSVDRQKEVMEKATALLGEISPVHKDRQETEQRFKGLEDSVTGLKGDISEIKDMLSGLTSQFK